MPDILKAGPGEPGRIFILAPQLFCSSVIVTRRHPRIRARDENENDYKRCYSDEVRCRRVADSGLQGDEVRLYLRPSGLKEGRQR
jgi:hypothetical protein